MPPALVIVQFENREMQMRRVRGGAFPSGADVYNHITLRDELTLVKAVRIVIEVRVVVTEALQSGSK